MFTFFVKKSFSFTYPCPRKLREIMKMSLIEREKKDKVIEIWKKYHENRTQNVCSFLMRKDYEYLLKKFFRN